MLPQQLFVFKARRYDLTLQILANSDDRAWEKLKSFLEAERPLFPSHSNWHLYKVCSHLSDNVFGSSD